MKKVLVISMFLGALPVMADEIDYKNCAGTLGELFSQTNKFAEMDSKGDFKINKESTSMEIRGNKIVYSSNSGESKKFSDKETFEIEYENITEGKPVGKIKSVSYNMKDLKDLDNKRPGAMDISFEYKNGHCIPLVKKVDNSAGLTGGLKLLYKGALAMGDVSYGERDLYKCKELHDYMIYMKELEVCINSGERFAKLRQLTANVEANSGKKAEVINEKKYKKLTVESLDALKEAYQATSACGHSGYKEILDDKEFWKKIQDDKSEVKYSEKVQAK